jgi:hypothetical protein
VVIFFSKSSLDHVAWEFFKKQNGHTTKKNHLKGLCGKDNGEEGYGPN